MKLTLTPKHYFVTPVIYWRLSQCTENYLSYMFTHFNHKRNQLLLLTMLKKLSKFTNRLHILNILKTHKALNETRKYSQRQPFFLYKMAEQCIRVSHLWVIKGNVLLPSSTSQHLREKMREVLANSITLTPSRACKIGASVWPLPSAT